MGDDTIEACSNRFGEEEGMEMEWCKEAEVENQIVEHGHCNMDPATRDMQVGHIHGLWEVVVVPAEGMAHPREVAHGKEVEVAVVNYRREEGVHTHPLLAARETGSRVFGDEDQSAVVNWLFEFDGLLEDSCMHLLSWHPGN